MDEVRDASGVALKRLYRLFPTKDQLIADVLRRREEDFRTSLAAHLAPVPPGRERLLAAFDFLYAWFSEPGFRGCPFINAYGELGVTDGTAADVVHEQKLAFEQLLTELASEAEARPALASQVFLLANGAMVAAAVLNSPRVAQDAKKAVAALLDC